MFRFVQTRVNVSPLLSSQLFDERSFYKSFISDLKHCQKQAIIESPFLTCRRSCEIASVMKKLLKRGVRVKVYTREPRHHSYRLRDEAIRSIQILRESGIKVYVCSDYRHRKVAVLDNSILWEGSLNILSQRRSREVMRRIESPQLCRQMLSFTGINRWFW